MPVSTRSTEAIPGSSFRAQSPPGSVATRTASRSRSPRSRADTAPWATTRPRWMIATDSQMCSTRSS